MKNVFTVADQDTLDTNGIYRQMNYDEALTEATRRVTQSGIQGVYILKAVELITPIRQIERRNLQD